MKGVNCVGQKVTRLAVVITLLCAQMSNYNAALYIIKTENPQHLPAVSGTYRNEARWFFWIRDLGQRWFFWIRDLALGTVLTTPLSTTSHPPITALLALTH